MVILLDTAYANGKSEDDSCERQIYKAGNLLSIDRHHAAVFGHTGAPMEYDCYAEGNSVVSFCSNNTAHLG